MSSAREGPVRKALIIGALALVAVIVGVGVFLYNSIDSIVKAGIEKYGSEITGTRVSVGSVDISLKSGRGTIRNVVVHNPKGFSSAHVFSLGEITVDLDVTALVIEGVRRADALSTTRGRELDGYLVLERGNEPPPGVLQPWEQHVLSLVDGEKTIVESSCA